MKKLLDIKLTNDIIELHYEGGRTTYMSIKELIEEVNNLHRVNQSNYRIITEFNSIVIKLLQDKQELAAKLREERAKTSMIRGGFKDELDKPSWIIELVN